MLLPKNSFWFWLQISLKPCLKYITCICIRSFSLHTFLLFSLLFTILLIIMVGADISLYLQISRLNIPSLQFYILVKIYLKQFYIKDSAAAYTKHLSIAKLNSSKQKSYNQKCKCVSIFYENLPYFYMQYKFISIFVTMIDISNT